jgi:hypothetical protein
MINDTVREELETKISRTPESLASTSGKLPAQPILADPPKKVETAPPPPMPAPKPIAPRFETADLGTKKTSKTLVEFQTPKATVPEWRLQLQNSVRQKVSGDRRSDPGSDVPQAAPRATNGANALKVEYVEEDQPARHQNPRVANALRRIEESRRTFSNQQIPEQVADDDQVGADDHGRRRPGRAEHEPPRDLPPGGRPHPSEHGRRSGLGIRLRVRRLAELHL